MALNLSDKFVSPSKINEIIDTLRNTDFHSERAKSKNLKKIDMEKNNDTYLKISRLIDFDIPVSAQRFVSNPILLVEIWTFESDQKITLKVSIPNIQTEVTASIDFVSEDSQTLILVETEVVSKIFLMSSFAEEFVSKYWKKSLQKDFEILNNWIKS
ncbi:MAG: hypothetical protein RL008_40 [Actinomycetota bacterium]|jgi:hypothetical protein